MRIATLLSIEIALAVCLLASAGLTTAMAQEAPLPKKKVSKKISKSAAETPILSESMTKATSDDSAAGSSGEALKFNTDYNPPATDNRPTMRFSDPGATPLGEKPPTFADQIPDEEPYKAYLGYPKHRFGASVSFMNLSSQWNYNGRDYNFPNSPVGLGLGYAMLINPNWNVGIDYSHYTMKLNSVNILPYRFNASTASYDEYYFKLRYCVVSSSSFYRQFCPGIDIGNDSYPILKFEGANDLYLNKVQDIVVGLNLNWQIPFADVWKFKASAGYNYGTGLGNTGALTTKTNNALLGSAGIEYQFPRLHSVNLNVDYKGRNAKLKGKVGNLDDTWTTKSTMLAIRAGYAYTWP